jgi:hypothetical protein
MTTISNPRSKNRQNAFKIVGEEVTATSARDAAHQAGLDWQVSLSDIHTTTLTPDGVNTMQVPNTFASVRTNKDGSQSVLGTVGGRYKVFQNDEMFSALDMLVDSGDARYAFAGEVKGGAQVYMVLELPKGVKIGNDEQIAPSIQRLRCTNQINGIFSKSATYNLKHTTNAEFKVEDIKKIIPVTYAGIDMYEGVGNRLFDMKLSDTEVDNIFKKMWSLPSIIEHTPYEMLSSGQRRQFNLAMNARSTAKGIYVGQTGTQEELYGTAYGVFHSVIEFADHFSHKSEATRAERIITGTADRIKNKALQVLIGA